MATLEEEAEKYASKRKELDPIYANGLYYGFVECGKSNWHEAEKIKAQIEILNEVFKEDGLLLAQKVKLLERGQLLKKRLKKLEK